MRTKKRQRFSVDRANDSEEDDKKEVLDTVDGRETEDIEDTKDAEENVESKVRMMIG